MGQQPLKRQQNQEQAEHQRLGHVRLQLKPADPNQQEQEEDCYLMNLKRTIQSQRIYKEWLRTLNQITDTQSKEVLLLPQKHSFESVGMCGSSGIAKLSFDYYQFVLKTEIANRQRLRKEFLETEVWYLLYNIVRAGSKFEHLKKKIGSVHPTNILINESGQIKIISTASMPLERNNYEMVLERQQDLLDSCYLAPEEINHDLIQKGSYPSHVDPSLAEVFCIGLTILSSGTLEDCNSVYMTNPWELRTERLNHLLKDFRNRYSDYLYETVSSMLALNPQDRRRCSSIAASLYEYENQILDLQPFTPSNFRPPQRPSYGYQQPAVQYSQPAVQYSQPAQQVVRSQSPVYYQNREGPHPVAASHTSYQQQVVRGPVLQGHQNVQQVPAYYNR